MTRAANPSARASAAEQPMTRERACMMPPCRVDERVRANLRQDYVAPARRNRHEIVKRRRPLCAAGTRSAILPWRSALRRMHPLAHILAVPRRLRAALALAWLLAASGCGFHLQGAGTLPPAMARTFVDTDRPHSEFLESLTDVLRQRGAEVLAAPAEGAAVLDITSDETGQRVLSVSARNIPREYEVFYAVTFSLRVGAESLISNESLVVTRSYTYDETEVLAKSSEEQILRDALAADLARRVMQRIQSLSATAAALPPH